MRGTLWLLASLPAATTASLPAVEPSIPGTCSARQLNPFWRPLRHTCPPPQSDIKRLRPYHHPPTYPWTHAVRCARGNRTTVLYCLYTDATFAGLHGVSLLTTPNTAADVVGADALEDRPYYGGSRTRLFRPGPFLNNAGRGPDSPGYVVAPTPPKGRGTVAQRRIPQGALAMMDVPALLVSRGLLERIRPRDRRRLLRRGLAQLPADTQARLQNLSRAAGGDALDGLLGTNTISLSLGRDEVHLGLFPELARVNHACNPNTYYRFSPRTLAIELVAYRDILPGEEITISYAQLTLSRTARRQFLQDNWHFDCACSLCRADPDAVTASEDHRRDMRKFQSELVQATRGGDFSAALAAADALDAATDAEGVTPLRAEMHDMRAALHLERGDFRAAEHYGRLALDAWERLDSIDDAQLQGARAFLGMIAQARAAYQEAQARQQQYEAEDAALDGDFL